jgi:hypothetical protein
VRVLGGDWPEGLPDAELRLPASRHWRPLQQVHTPSSGLLSRLLAALSGDHFEVVRWPYRDVLQVLDTCPLLDQARITARFGGGWMVGETIAAGWAHGRCPHYGAADNFGPPERSAGSRAALDIRVIISTG